MGQMKKYNQLLNEMPSKTVVFAFGRFQPPTTGHELLVKAVAHLAQQKRADHVIIASKTQDKKKNPLTVERKVHYLRMMFPRINFMAATPDVRTFIEAAKMLNKKYKNIIMVAGSDRVQEFTTLLNRYNGKDFKFDSIEVISAGKRDPDSDSADGMSGTKMRIAAEKGNYVEFKKGLPSTMRDIDGRRLMNDIRMGLGMQAVREQVSFKKDELREQYFQGKIFNIGDTVEDYDGVYKIVNRGSNHILVQENSGELVSKWIQDVKPTEAEFMLDEALSNKTLKSSDKIKVGRVIATMLGVENAEAMSNPTQMVNLGLRNIKKKALNSAALELIQKMIDLAKSMDIQYDKNLVPAKIKEGVIQPNGTDKIPVQTGSDSTVVVDKKSKRNAAKDVLRFSDFKKLQKVQEDEDKETESDIDAEFDDAPEETKVGGLMARPYSETDDNLRRRKVAYRVHEEASAGGEAAQKRAQKEKQRAQLQLKQTKEKEALRARQEREREQMKNEETESLEEKDTHVTKDGRTAKKGLWYNINQKRKRGEKPAKPGDKDYPKTLDIGEETKVDTEKEVAAKERDAKTKGVVRPSGAVTEVPEEMIVVENCYDDLSQGGGPVVDVDDVTSSVNPPHEEKFENSDVDQGEWDDNESDYAKQIDILDFGDDRELDAIVASMTDDEFIELAYEDDELEEIDDETGEPVELDDEEKELDESLRLVEGLSRMERIKARQRLKRTAAKRKRSTKISMKRISNTKTANLRARRAAIKKLKQRVLRGRSTSQLSVGEKERVEKFVAGKKNLINRLAMKMLPRVRQIEKKRLQNARNKR